MTDEEDNPLSDKIVGAHTKTSEKVNWPQYPKALLLKFLR